MVTVKLSEKSILSLADNLYIADYNACFTSFNSLTTPAYYNNAGVVITAYAVEVPWDYNEAEKFPSPSVFVAVRTLHHKVWPMCLWWPGCK